MVPYVFECIAVAIPQVAARRCLTISAKRDDVGVADLSSELAELTWIQAERILTPQAIVLIPLGAACKEHGPHLRLDNDYRLAEALKRQVMRRCNVVVAPTLTFHHYPAFTQYPGSISLESATARDLVVDVVRSLASYGPRRFYVLNTGVSTTGPLGAAAKILAEDGLALGFTDIEATTAVVDAQLLGQVRGAHADEGETSMMLHLAPARVDMGKAVRDDRPRSGRGGFQRESGRPGIYSPSGVWGDATLATARKGEVLVSAMVDAIVADIERMRAG